jgi:hypothetical protein
MRSFFEQSHSVIVSFNSKDESVLNIKKKYSIKCPKGSPNTLICSTNSLVEIAFLLEKKCTFEISEWGLRIAEWFNSAILPKSHHSEI